jgi:tRNA G18 (ribose-2'-O)-methylase SpoU
MAQVFSSHGNTRHSASQVLGAVQQALLGSELDGCVGTVVLPGSLADELNATSSSEQLRAIYGLLARVQRLVKTQLFPGRGKSSGKEGRKQHRQEHLQLMNLEASKSGQEEEEGVAPPLPPVTENCNVITQIDDASDTRVDLFRLQAKTTVMQADIYLKAQGLFLVQSHLVVEVLLRYSKYKTVAVLATQTKLDKLAGHFSPCTQPCSCPKKYAATEACVQEIGGYGFPVDCMALAKRPAQHVPLLEQAGSMSHSTIVALERLASENVGSIARSAVAFGASAMFVCPGCADPLSRKAVRASMGAILRLPFVRAKSWPEELCKLKTAGYILLATCLSPKAIPFDQLPANFNWQKVVLLLGNEGDGLSAETLQLSDYHIQIDMDDPVIDSLSVGHAAAVALAQIASSRKQQSIMHQTT